MKKEVSDHICRSCGKHSIAAARALISDIRPQLNPFHFVISDRLFCSRGRRLKTNAHKSPKFQLKMKRFASFYLERV